MQHLAILAYIELLQRTTLIGYCSALMKLSPVEAVMQSVVLHLFLVIENNNGTIQTIINTHRNH